MRHVLFGCATCLAFAAPAAAHHGPGTFDLRSSISYPVATLTGVDLINPHSWLYFEVTGPDGKVSKHRCEMRSVHTLRRSGWTQDLFPAGAQIAIEASPDRADPNSCYLQTIRFANGSHMDRYGQYVKAPDGGIREVRGPLVVPTREQRAFRRPSGEPNIAGDWAPEQRVMTNPRGTGGGLVALGQLPEFDRARSESAAAGGAGPARGPGGPGGPGAAPAGPRLYGGTALTAEGESRGRGVRARGQSALQLRDDEHPLRLDVRRPRQPHRANRRRDHAALRPDGARADDPHERGRAPGQRRAEPRRAIPSAAGRTTCWSSRRRDSCPAC